MNNKKQSSIDFLIEQIEIILKLNNIKLNVGYNIHTILPIIEKLKAMHKEEIIESYCQGCFDITKDDAIFPRETSEQYYNETFEK
jgi:hypothetical protein